VASPGPLSSSVNTNMVLYTHYTSALQILVFMYVESYIKDSLGSCPFYSVLIHLQSVPISNSGCFVISCVVSYLPILLRIGLSDVSNWDYDKKAKYKILVPFWQSFLLGRHLRMKLLHGRESMRLAFPDTAKLFSSLHSHICFNFSRFCQNRKATQNITMAWA
jgi:hypothetical protein